MNITEILVLVLIFCVIMGKQIKDYLLRKEEIKASAMIKAEEIMAKNKLELEKLLYKEEQKAAENTGKADDGVNSDEAFENKTSEKIKQ